MLNPLLDNYRKELASCTALSRILLRYLHSVHTHYSNLLGCPMSNELCEHVERLYRTYQFHNRALRCSLSPLGGNFPVHPTAIPGQQNGVPQPANATRDPGTINPLSPSPPRTHLGDASNRYLWMDHQSGSQHPNGVNLPADRTGTIGHWSGQHRPPPRRNSNHSTGNNQRDSVNHLRPPRSYANENERSFPVSWARRVCHPRLDIPRDSPPQCSPRHSGTMDSGFESNQVHPRPPRPPTPHPILSPTTIRESNTVRDRIDLALDRL